MTEARLEEQSALTSAVERIMAALQKGDEVSGGPDWSGGTFRSKDVRTLLDAVKWPDDGLVSVSWPPTPTMIDEGAQRLASFEDNSVWPDSWSKIDVVQMRILSERVLRSGIAAGRVSPTGRLSEASEEDIIERAMSWGALHFDDDNPDAWREAVRRFARELK